MEFPGAVKGRGVVIDRRHLAGRKRLPYLEEQGSALHEPVGKPLLHRLDGAQCRCLLIGPMQVVAMAAPPLVGTLGQNVAFPGFSENL